MVKRKTIWDNTAKQQLKEIVQYIKKDSVQNAEKVRVDIIQTSRSLEGNPEKFSPDKFKIVNPGSIYRAFEIHKIRISYKVEDDRVLVVRCRHTKQRPLFY